MSTPEKLAKNSLYGEVVRLRQQRKLKGTVVCCFVCGESHKLYTLSSSEERLIVHGIIFEYLETVARCSVCGEMVYVPEINDANARAREEAFEAAAKRKREEEK